MSKNVKSCIDIKLSFICFIWQSTQFLSQFIFTFKFLIFLKMDFWSKFEYHIRDRVPDFLIKLLKNAGYDTGFSVKLLNNELVDQLESFANEQNPKPEQPVKILPGHRATLLALPSTVENYEKNIDESIALSRNSISSRTHSCEDTHFSFILSKLIETAKKNMNKDPNHRRYPQELHYFAMYMYIMCGKSAYEVLSKNIPLPQASTTCEFETTKCLQWYLKRI